MGNTVTVSFQDHDRLKKTAGLFVGLGHLQPLLLATTNANYLLDRFCMERYCSSEYVSRIVTSLIFMEILATLLVACLGVYIACTYSSEWSTTTGLNDWNEYKEEPWRGRVSTGILFLIFLCYFQIFYAFTSGGRKGHMHWFYASLLIQQFVCLLIGGAIGFWEAGTTLWYLMAIPMGPIPVFFYQLMIHSWIRNNGPRDVEYLVVECQILLAAAISALATIFWAAGYLISYIPIELEIQGLANPDPTSTDAGRIATGTAKTLALTNGHVTGNSKDLGSGVNAKVTLTTYSANLVTVEGSGSNKALTLTVKAGLTILFDKSDSAGTLTVQSATKTGQPTLKYTPSSSNITLNSVTPLVNVNKTNDPKEVTLSLAIEEIKGTIASSSNINFVKVTIPVKVEVVKTAQGGGATTVPISSVILSIPVPTQAETKQLTLRVDHSGDSGTNTLKITVEAKASGTGSEASVKEVDGKGFYPKFEGYCFYSVRDGTPSTGKKDIWANLSGKCLYAACYKGTSAGKNPALLILYILGGGSPNIRYFGTENAGNSDWKEISEAKFIEKLPTLASGSLTLDGDTTPQYNRVYHPNSWRSWTLAPLVMHGMAVGAVGSIFPNLIPKTLTCPKTTRNLSVINMFMVTVPHIINLALAEYDSNPASCAWTVGSGIGWLLSYSLYLFYGLAFLFAIFNVHYPEWKLCCYIRSHGWMPFMMTLSITLIIEILIAIARAGIMMQRPANGKDKNHPLLWNKMACLMSLSYLPFWLTTTPMMKSYVSSLDPFLCDKDRDHWPTARYGAWRSGWYWCKCACRGLYNSPRKLVTLNMRKALTRKDPQFFYTLYGLLLMVSMEEPRHHYTHLDSFDSSLHILLWESLGRDSSYHS